ncbi:ATP-binding protein [Clostridium frigidicarnis]|uniref:AAA domain-containing protein n=1 Tax=Clostridium frigidicarnis TaxID=84698 RepID=A0A1I0XYM6_9CLOT|nr:AAA family ATPase [Clostridium frigidicarnis]SFB05777.1 AAA domain-containing protein [Clostridium frigidicarnis]
MIIKKLNIKAFGKIKDKEIELKKGFNIIYGENEKGKSTIQGFMRVMLYGMSLNKKSLRENDRKRFTPWSGEKPCGEMIIKNKNEDILIKRDFGGTKRDDEALVINNITGEEIKVDKISPGRDLLGLSINGFLKTLFIGQLSLGIAGDKDDEILHKLSNLENLNHDDVSYQSALKILEDYKKIWTSQRKGGKLNDLREQLELLNSEYREALSLNEGNIEDNITLNKLKDQRELVVKDIKALELYKKHIKKIKLNKEYNDILQYLRKTKELKSMKGKVQEGLGEKQDNLNEEFLQKLWNDYYSYNELRSLYEKLKGKYSKLKIEEEDFQIKLEKYEGFLTLEDDVNSKVRALIEERDLLKNNLKQYEEIENEITNIEKKLKSIEVNKEKLNIISEIKEKSKEKFSVYEEKLKELKYFLNSNDIDYDTLSKEKSINKNINVYRGVTIIGFGLLTIAIIIMIIISSVKPLILGAIGIIISLYSTTNGNKLSVSKNIINIEKNKKEKLDKINMELESIEEELKDLAYRAETKDFKTLFLKIKEYEDIENNEEYLKIKLESKMLSINNEDLKSNLIKNEKFIDFILSHTKCRDENEFFEKYNDYKNVLHDYSLIKRELIEKKELIDSQDKLVNEKFKSIKTKLESLNKNHITFDRIEDEIKDLWEKLKIKNSIEKELYQVENSYKLLLKDRDLEDIKNEIGEIAEGSFKEDFNNEEEIEESYKKKNNELVQIEKKLRDVDNSINNRFSGKRDAWQIMQQIVSVKEEILNGEEEVEILDLALENLRLSFKEVQKSFGPKLNKRVKEIFREVTDNAYDEVKVGEDYGMLVRDNLSSELVDIQSLSNGCEDQLYFSLRIALLDMLFAKEETVPIILDESFVQYDDNRLKNTLDFLYEYSKHKQVILCTCQNREIKIMNKFNDVNIVYL